MNDEPVTAPQEGTVAGDGLARIAAERRRQVEVEGWTPEHDAEHDRGELATAGVGYAMFAVEQIVLSTLTGEELSDEAFAVPPSETQWPWNPNWWKPSADPIRNLEKAGALIAAEIDRLLRQAERNGRVRDALGGEA